LSCPVGHPRQRDERALDEREARVARRRVGRRQPHADADADDEQRLGDGQRRHAAEVELGADRAEEQRLREDGPERRQVVLDDVGVVLVGARRQPGDDAALQQAAALPRERADEARR
jgi:hypothetical protein